jgi:hypothetical protein
MRGKKTSSIEEDNLYDAYIAVDANTINDDSCMIVRGASGTSGA